MSGDRIDDEVYVMRLKVVDESDGREGRGCCESEVG